jgi:hypothetical protein
MRMPYRIYLFIIAMVVLGGVWQFFPDSRSFFLPAYFILWAILMLRLLFK